jgi:hypothetical protein
MDLELVKAFLEENKSNEEVIGTLKGYVPAEVKEAELNLDKVKGYLHSNPEAQSFLDTAKKNHLEAWKAKELKREIESEISKRYPNETEEQKRIRELEQKIEQAEKNQLLERLRLKAKDVAHEKGLPFELVDHFLGGDEEETLANLNKLETTYKKAVEEAVKRQLGQDGYTPQQGNSSTFTAEDVLKMSEEELTQNWDQIKHLLK